MTLGFGTVVLWGIAVAAALVGGAAGLACLGGVLLTAF
jgi:hypothetical protein